MKIRSVARLWQRWVTSKCLFQILWIIEISAVEEHVMINTSHHWHICAHLREIGLVTGVIWVSKDRFFQRQISLGKKFFSLVQNTLKHTISKVFFEKVKKNRTFLLISTKPLQKGRCIRCTLHGLSPGVSLFLIRSSISQQFWNRLILTIQKMGRVWPYGQQKRFYRYKRVSSHSGIVVIPKSRRWKFVAWHVCGSAGWLQNVYSKSYGLLRSLQ